MPQQYLKTRKFLKSHCSSVQVGRLKELEGVAVKGGGGSSSSNRHRSTQQEVRADGQAALIFSRPLHIWASTRRCCLLGGAGGSSLNQSWNLQTFLTVPTFLSSVTETQQTQRSPYQPRLSYEHYSILVTVGISIIFINHSLEKECNCH